MPISGEIINPLGLTKRDGVAAHIVLPVENHQKLVNQDAMNIMFSNENLFFFNRLMKKLVEGGPLPVEFRSIFNDEIRSLIADLNRVGYMSSHHANELSKRCWSTMGLHTAHTL